MALDHRAHEALELLELGRREDAEEVAQDVTLHAQHAGHESAAGLGQAQIHDATVVAPVVPLSEALALDAVRELRGRRHRDPEPFGDMADRLGALLRQEVHEPKLTEGQVEAHPGWRVDQRPGGLTGLEQVGDAVDGGSVTLGRDGRAGGRAR